ncbi:MAG: hypothetical protein WA053_01530 [Minisyncoccia bacterium]
MSLVFKTMIVSVIITLVAVAAFLMLYPHMLGTFVAALGIGFLLVVGFTALDSVHYDREVSRYCDALDAVLPHGGR